MYRCLQYFLLMMLIYLNSSCGPFADRSNRSSSAGSCYRGDAFICQVEAEIVRLTNEKRAGLGLRPLRQSFETSFAARHHSINQAQTQTMSHRGFPLERQELLRNEFSGLQLTLLAENVAAGLPATNNPTMIARYFVELWWNSPGHRKNILGSYSFLGAGLAMDPRNGDYHYATQLFH